MSFQSPYDKRLNILNEQLVDRNILLDGSNSISESFIQFQAGESL